MKDIWYSSGKDIATKHKRFSLAYTMGYAWFTWYELNSQTAYRYY